MRYGGHYSASRDDVRHDGSMTSIVKRIVELDWQLFQIFFGSHKSYNRKNPSDIDIRQALKLLEEHNIHFYTHFPYIMNLAKLDVRIDSVQTELTRIAKLGGRCVIHPNSYTDAKYSNRQISSILSKMLVVEDPQSTSTGIKTNLTKAEISKLAQWRSDYYKAIDNIIENLTSLDYPDNVEYPLLLEPPAGEGKKFGWCMEQLEALFERTPDQVGLCIDTCHLFAAGECRFDSAESVDKLFGDLDRVVGLRKVKLVHLNDSKAPFASMKDQHAPLTQGEIWSDGIQGLVRLWQLCIKHEIDVVSEVSSEIDHKVMQQLDLHINQS